MTNFDAYLMNIIELPRRGHVFRAKSRTTRSNLQLNFCQDKKIFATMATGHAETLSHKEGLLHYVVNQDTKLLL